MKLFFNREQALNSFFCTLYVRCLQNSKIKFNAQRERLHVSPKVAGLFSCGINLSHQHMISEVHEFKKASDDNIWNVLRDGELFGNLFDIVLFRDICNIIECCYKNTDVILSGGNFLFSNVQDYSGETPEFKLLCSNKKYVLSNESSSLEFSTPEAVRKYLYGLVGFFYQPNIKGSNISEDNVMDPYISMKFIKPRPVTDYLADLSLIRGVHVPIHSRDVLNR